MSPDGRPLDFPAVTREASWWRVRCLALGLSCAAVGCTPEPATPLAEIAAILALDSAAHVSGDATTLASIVADSVVSVDNGTVSTMSREDVERGFQGYFDSVDIVSWIDETEPEIRFSPSGSAVSVTRAVRMERDTRALGGGVVRDTIVLAWTAGFEKVDSAWKMVTVSTTTRSAGTSVAVMLASVLRAVGWAGPQRPEGIVLRARVEWAGPPYEVEVASARSGAAKLTFVDGASMGLGLRDRWASVQPDSFVALSDTMETFLRGHDFVFNLVEPGPRFGPLRFAGTTRFAGQAAFMIAGRDVLGGAVRLYYSRADSLPLGFEVEDHLRGGPTVTTEILAWSAGDGARLPERVRFRQGAEVFDYTITDAQTFDLAPDSLFARPPPA
jgi:hypothetical protein